MLSFIPDKTDQLLLETEIRYLSLISIQGDVLMFYEKDESSKVDYFHAYHLMLSYDHDIGQFPNNF